MLTRTFTVSTRADTTTVGAYLSDFRHHEDWRDDVISSEVESGTAGRDGTIYRQYVRQGPGTAWRQLRASVSPDARHIEFHTLGEAPAVASGEYAIEPSDKGTTVHATVRITFHGGGRALRPIVRRTMDGRLEGYVRALTSKLDELALPDESVV